MGAVNSTEAATAVAQQNIVTMKPLDVTSVDRRSAAACPVPGVGLQGKYSGSISDCPVLGGEASGGKFMSECPMSEEERRATDQVDPLNMVRFQRRSIGNVVRAFHVIEIILRIISGIDCLDK